MLKTLSRNGKNYYRRLSAIPTILIIENSVSFTGAFKSIFHFCKELKDEFNFVFALPENATHTHLLEAEKFEFLFLNFLELSYSLSSIKYPLILCKNTAKLMSVIKAKNINIVHVNDIYNMLGCTLKTLNPSIKVIYHVRLLKNSYIRHLYPFFLLTVKRMADQIICVSKAVKNDAGHSNKAIVVYDFIPQHEKHPKKIILKNTSCLNLLYVGKFVRGKGQHFGLQALLKVKNKLPAIQYTMVGENTNNSYYQELCKIIKENKLSKTITIKGFVEDVEKEMKTADIVLNFSESESFSMVCLEAQMYGVPIIASDCGGPTEIIAHGETGLIVPNRNINKMTEAILLLANDYTLRKKLSLNGRRRARKIFNKNQTINKLREVYYSLLGYK